MPFPRKCKAIMKRNIGRITPRIISKLIGERPPICPIAIAFVTTTSVSHYAFWTSRVPTALPIVEDCLPVIDGCIPLELLPPARLPFTLVAPGIYYCGLLTGTILHGAPVVSSIISGRAIPLTNAMRGDTPFFQARSEAHPRERRHDGSDIGAIRPHWGPPKLKTGKDWDPG